MPPAFIYTYLTLDILALALLCLVAIKDIKTCEIPDRYVIALGALSLVVVAARYMSELSITVNMVGMLLVLPLMLIGLEGKLGGGDYKLLLVLGLYLGVYRFILMSICGALFALIPGIVAMKRQNSRKVKLALGPYIALGFFFTIAVRWLDIMR